MRYGKDILEEITSFGGLSFYLFITILSYLVIDIRLMYILLVGLIFSYIITIIIRLLYPKERPNKLTYRNIFEKIDASSFPSMHSIRITLILCIISYYYRSIIVLIFLLIVAIGVYYSRYHLKKHYPNDIIAGIILGLIESGFIIYFLF